MSSARAATAAVPTAASTQMLNCIHRKMVMASPARYGHAILAKKYGDHMLRISIAVTAVLLSTSQLMAQGKGMRLWNLTTATISSFQLSPAGKDNWGPNQTLNDRDK